MGNDSGNAKDIAEHEDEFAFDFGAYCIGRTIRGIRVSHDRVELHLDEGKSLAFRVDGEDIRIMIQIPKSNVGPERVQ